MRTCKNPSCKTKFEAVYSSIQPTCGIPCAIALGKIKTAQKASKAHRVRKREFRENDIKIRKTAAKSACHKYIRERDRGQPCICCGRTLGNKYDAGHFLESGNNPHIRYHEDNIHAQSVHCNQYKGGDSGEYELRLRKKIGDDRLDYLKANKSGTLKRTASDYREIEDYFKAKIKELT